MSGSIEMSSNLDSTNSLLVLTRFDLVVGCTKFVQANLASPTGINLDQLESTKPKQALFLLLINNSEKANSCFFINLSYPLLPFVGTISEPTITSLYPLSLDFGRKVMLHLSQSFISPENPWIFSCISPENPWIFSCISVFGKSRKALKCEINNQASHNKR
jgi:hypothetical protein